MRKAMSGMSAAFVNSAATKKYRQYLSAMAAGAVLLVTACSETQQPYDVAEVPLTQISADLASGKTTSAALTKAYIDRIKKYDGVLHSVILIAPDAMDQAKASDDRRKAGKALGRMDGVPILLKDNIDAVGMPTTAGSYAFIDNYPVQDSEVARRLREAGAIILGKLNMDQFASWRGTKGTLNGTTVGGGPTNPYRPGFSTSGSSSGSAVAAAASFAAATVGSDTTGSIIGPASVQGLAGMRPTLALISRRGVLPVSMSQDTTGPMARSVADMAALLTVMAGTDPGDPATKEADAHKTDYLKGLDSNALKGARLGVVRGTSNDNESTAHVFEKALKVLADQGAVLVDVPVTFFEDLFPEQHTLIHWEFREDLEAYLKNAPSQVKVRTLADLIEFNKTDPRENAHAQELLEADLANKGRAEPAYATTLEYAQRRAGPEGLGAALTKYDVQAFVMVNSGPARQRGARRTGASSIYLNLPPKGQSKISPSGISALAGFPDVSVPIGLIDGLPIGMSLIGPKWSEQLLLSLAYAYEQVAKARVAPTAYLEAADSAEAAARQGKAPEQK